MLIDSDMQNILGKVVIPQVAVNSYLFRTLPIEKNVKNETETDGVEEQIEAEVNDYRLQWPAILTIDTLDTPIVRMCPQNMHMLVWGSNKPLRARVFHHSTSHHFNPVAGIIDSDMNISLPLHITSYPGSGFPKISKL